MSRGPGKLVLVLGGARSGKSVYAERLAARSGKPVVYIATAEARDEEMRVRIATHRQRRAPAWRTIEAPLALAEAVRDNAGDGRLLLVDCLTLWLSNALLAECDLEAETAALLGALDRPAGPIIAVSNEVGHGIVPATKLGRQFRDQQGRLNQMVASCATDVVMVIAGSPVVVKPLPEPEIPF